MQSVLLHIGGGLRLSRIAEPGDFDVTCLAPKVSMDMIQVVENEAHWFGMLDDNLRRDFMKQCKIGAHIDPMPMDVFISHVVKHRGHRPSFAGQILVVVGAWVDMLFAGELKKDAVSTTMACSRRDASLDPHIADLVALGEIQADPNANIEHGVVNVVSNRKAAIKLKLCNNSTYTADGLRSIRAT